MLYDGEKLLTEWHVIPSSIKAILCQCMTLRGSNSVYRDGSKGDPALDWKTGKCTRCFRYDISRAYTCTECEKHFVKNFKHPFWCYYHNSKCWDCIERTTEPACGINRDCDGLRSWHNRMPPPEVAIRNIQVTWSAEEAELFG